MPRLCALMLAAILSLGCQETRRAPSIAQIDTSTPEGQFEWAMEKLDRAVLEFRPSHQDGLQVGKRKVSSEIFPPDVERQHYTAQVVIESETLYLFDQQPETAEQEREQRRREKVRQNFERQVASEDPPADSAYDPLQEKFLSQMEGIAVESRVPRGPEPILDTPHVSDRKVYELAYLEDRWQLQTEPETEYERLWFEYALKQ